MQLVREGLALQEGMWLWALRRVRVHTRCKLVMPIEALDAGASQGTVHAQLFLCPRAVPAKSALNNRHHDLAVEHAAICGLPGCWQGTRPRPSACASDCALQAASGCKSSSVAHIHMHMRAFASVNAGPAIKHGHRPLATMPSYPIVPSHHRSHALNCSKGKLTVSCAEGPHASRRALALCMHAVPRSRSRGCATPAVHMCIMPWSLLK